MGYLLSHPQISMGIQTETSDKIDFTSLEMQGYRDSMEDNQAFKFNLKNFPNYSAFAVFDGHCSAKVSFYLAKTLIPEIETLSEITRETVVKKIAEMDRDLILNDPGMAQDGSTIILALIENSSFPMKSYIFNLGDSRCFQFKQSTNECYPLSADHKPSNKGEKERIVKAKGYVSNDSENHSRVDGNLAMSRAFGDSIYKKDPLLDQMDQKVIPLAEMQETEINKGDLLFLTCDGIFEGTTWESVFEGVKKKISQFKNTEEINGVEMGKFLIKNALKTSKDNMSVIVLKFGEFERKGLKETFIPTNILHSLGSNAFMKGYLDTALKYGTSIEDALFEGLKNEMDIIKNKATRERKFSEVLSEDSQDEYPKEEVETKSKEEFLEELKKKIRKEIDSGERISDEEVDNLIRRIEDYLYMEESNK